MISELMARFNENTQDRYSFLRLASSSVSISQSLIRLTFFYPAQEEELLKQQKNKVIEALDEVLKLKEFKVEYLFKRSHFDAMHFIRRSLEFFSSFPAVHSFIRENSFEVERVDECYNVRITLPAEVTDFVNESNVVASYEQFISTQYCERVSVEFLRGSDDELICDEPSAANVVDYSIYPKNIVPFIGEMAGDRAEFIDSIIGECSAVVLAGKVSYFTRLEKKQKSGVDYKDEFYKFTLSDLSGSINCLYFPTKKSFELIGKLQEGREVICSGEVKLDNYRGGDSKVFHVRRISYCEIVKEELPQRFNQPPKRYSRVFPLKCVHNEQINFLDPTLFRNNPLITDNTYVVFDLETTGLSGENDRIIEIGAVKIKGGVICEEFSTFVNPRALISERITEITGIRQEDLEDAPFIEDVIGDFMLFVQDSTLIAHNLPFDIAFMSRAAKDGGYLLPQHRLDTIELARALAPEAGGYKLSVLAKHFNIINKEAHRAVHDARATAELFLKLVDRITPDKVKLIS